MKETPNSSQYNRREHSKLRHIDSSSRPKATRSTTIPAKGRKAVDEVKEDEMQNIRRREESAVSMAKPTKHLQCFCITAFIICLIACPAESLSDPGLSRDVKILSGFKKGVENDPFKRLESWTLSRSVSGPCNWPGVTCKENRVSRLDLSGFKIESNFSSVFALFGLEKLEAMDLSFNGIHGNLSFGSAACSQALTVLNLSANKLQGPLSSNLLGLCPSLHVLNISSNKLENLHDSAKGFFMPVLRELDLSSNSLDGASIVGSLLSGCPKLERLSVAKNKISAFPTNKLSLQHLDLSSNAIAGRFAGFQSCPNLVLLDLSANQLTGQLNPSLGNCKELRTLNLSVNQFSGSISASFGAGLDNIEKLLISGNKLQGSIPPELGSWVCGTLQELDLSSNSITGTIPSSFTSCTSLHTINLSNNNVSGPFPESIVSNLPSLRTLVLAYNNISGTLPASVSSFANLEVLDLSSNEMEGAIPSSFCSPGTQSPPSLQKLYLQNNNFSGTIPLGLADCTQLRSIDLSFNYISGTIPATLGSLQFLQDLVMWMNQLQGEIPDELSNVKTLENLILDNNALSGTIPSGLRNCRNLVWISLSSNKLTGSIPSWIGKLDKLAILQLGHNSLSGIIPKELGDCKSLIWLDLNSNSLEGSIPPALSAHSGKILAGAVSGKMYAFVRNEPGSVCRGAVGLVEFAGIRQEEISRIPMLHSCKFTRVYTGTTMYEFKDNGTMMFLDLSYNSLSGSIPDGIGSMYYLQVLNLGHNLLSGSIPSSLGGLKKLGLLDLSHNNLSGRIPPTLSGLSFMTDLDVSDNNLTGEIPTGGQLSTFPSERYANNPGLCGLPLQPCSADRSSDPAFEDHSRSHRNQASLAGSVAMGLLFSLVCIFGMIVVVIETRRKRKQEEVRDIYMDSLPTSGNGSWKLTGVLEPLSINVATFEKPLRKLTFAHLLEATNGFHADTLIGSGGFGDVYKAQLKDGSVVAIKKLIHISGQGDREFMAEMETIGKIKHRNLVPLLGYCKVGEERLLVYEYMKWGSLENVLHNQQKGGIRLNWPARKKIAIGAARGLAFLHHSCIPHIIHRDMKSSNVLIDENLEARVSDFGMARLLNAMDTHLSVSSLAGTPGYVPPEYYQSFRCSTKGDVYSYGVILLELLTGRQPTGSVDFGDNNIVGWVKLQAKIKISDIFDPELMKDPSLEVELLQHLRIACECLDDRPLRRPTMIQVLAMFRELQKDGEETELDSFSLVGTTVDEAADPEV